MKEQIENILIKVDEGTMPVQQALSEILLLFSVSRSATTDEEEIIDAYIKFAKDYYPKKKPIVL